MADGINDCIRDLEEYCESNETLSLDVLRDKLGHLSAMETSGSHFLHELCLNKYVTLEMVQLVLEFNPFAAYFCSNRYAGMDYDDDDVNAYEADFSRPLRM